MTPLDGQAAPAFTLSALDGRRLALADFKGQVVLLYFWASWSPHCTRELPSTIEKVYRELKDGKLAVLAINIQEDLARVEAWVKAKGFTPPVLLDRAGAVAAAYRVTATPTAVLVGRDGRMLARATGTRPWDSRRRPGPLRRRTGGALRNDRARLLAAGAARPRSRW